MGINEMKNLILGAIGAAMLTLAGTAGATVVNTLPGGTSVAIPAVNDIFTTTPLTLQPGIVASPAPTSTFAVGYTGNYGFSSNGSWSGASMIGLDQPTGYFTIDFSTPISGFLGELNWASDYPANDATLAIYGTSGLLETLTLENSSGNAVTPGYWGFSRASADITSVRFSNEYIGVRDISITTAAAVPEPEAYALMMAGLVVVGGMSRRQQQRKAPAAKV